MTKVEELEMELADAELHLAKAKAAIETFGLSGPGLTIYLDARKSVDRLREELACAKKNLEWLKGEENPRLFHCQKGKFSLKNMEKYGIIQEVLCAEFGRISLN